MATLRIKYIGAEPINIVQEGESIGSHGVRFKMVLEDDQELNVPCVWTERDFEKNTPAGASSLVEQLIVNLANASMDYVREVSRNRG